MQRPMRTRGVLEAQSPRSPFTRHLLLPTEAFLRTESLGGGVLLACAAAAVGWANSPWGGAYDRLKGVVLGIDAGLFAIEMDLLHWINDGLMVLFFFVVGLEIKRELVLGELADLRRAALPAAAAMGGLLAPALIFLALNLGGEGVRGWGIPMATDIAFALGVLALLGDRVPTQVRILLLALAIADDIAAILVIALFYTEGLSLGALGVALLLLGVVVAMRYAGVIGFGPYVLVGALIWVAVLKSGVHATIAGVALGLLTPSAPRYARGTFLETARGLLGRYEDAVEHGEGDRVEGLLGRFEELSLGTESPLHRLERRLHPWASYLVLPLFALANAGVVLSSEATAAAASSRVTWGIMLGLLVGKVVGVAGLSWLAIRLGLAARPGGVRWAHLAGVGLLAGIGFTMSLFITELAYDHDRMIAEAKMGILVASVLAGLGGYALFRAISGPRTADS